MITGTASIITQVWFCFGPSAQSELPYRLLAHRTGEAGVVIHPGSRGPARKTLGKRGLVQLTPAASARSTRPATGSAGAHLQTRAVGTSARSVIGLAGVATLVGMLMLGLGSGGFIPGLLGGLLAHRLMQSAPSPTVAPSTAPNAGQTGTTTAITRGGFGATGMHVGGTAGS